ncbi:MAG: VOC family protein [Pseudomonadales bacterium]
MTVKHIHHINFLVRDLDAAVEKYTIILGQPKDAAQYNELPGRGVRMARFKLGQTWLVLVQPLGDEGIPAQHLRDHGEGFFLMSLDVDDVVVAGEQLQSKGVVMDDIGIRHGLDDWQVWDIDAGATYGAQLQLCQDS